jgi:hypothetical protein
MGCAHVQKAYSGFGLKLPSTRTGRGFGFGFGRGGADDGGVLYEFPGLDEDEGAFAGRRGLRRGGEKGNWRGRRPVSELASEP